MIVKLQMASIKDPHWWLEDKLGFRYSNLAAIHRTTLVGDDGVVIWIFILGPICLRLGFRKPKWRLRSRKPKDVAVPRSGSDINPTSLAIGQTWRLPFDDGEAMWEITTLNDYGVFLHRNGRRFHADRAEYLRQEFEESAASGCFTMVPNDKEHIER